jgi:hypothetical protein
MLFKSILIASAFALLSGTVVAEELGAPRPNVHLGPQNHPNGHASNGLHPRNPTLLDEVENLALAGSSTPAQTPLATPTGSQNSLSHVAQPSPTQAPRRKKRTPALLSNAGPTLEKVSSRASPAVSTNLPNQASSMALKRALATPSSTPSSVPVHGPSSAIVIHTPTPRPSMMKRIKLT